eukprot:3040788-Amphidinium_carterae.1
MTGVVTVTPLSQGMQIHVLCTCSLQPCPGPDHNKLITTSVLFQEETNKRRLAPKKITSVLETMPNVFFQATRQILLVRCALRNPEDRPHATRPRYTRDLVPVIPGSPGDHN